MSMRATRTSTPVPTMSPSTSYLNARSREATNGSKIYAGGAVVHNRGSSLSQMSATTAGTVARKAPHNRRKPNLIGRGSNQPASYNAVTAPASGISPVLFANGVERHQDVDVAAIGRISGHEEQLQGQHGKSYTLTSTESTAAGVDNLFARFGVKDVKAIAIRGQQKEEGKREELRTMVGERYRDLLSTADSIVRMRKSSRSLLGKLDRARDSCDRDVMVSRALEDGECARGSAHWVLDYLASRYGALQASLTIKYAHTRRKYRIQYRNTCQIIPRLSGAHMAGYRTRGLPVRCTTRGHRSSSIPGARF